MSPSTVVHRRRFGPADRAEAVYRTLPVEVEREAPGLTVTLAYDRQAAVVDLGLIGPQGFRGWSGGARDLVTVGPDRATPGYLPGPVVAGVWSVLLGLHRVPEEGVLVVVEARFAPGPLAPPPPPPPMPAVRPPTRPPARDGWRWVAGDLHSHTVHSDGALSIDELAALARSEGLDFLAVTDHNTVSHHPHLPASAARYGLTLVPGQELTTDQGHANCLGDVGWVDFRRSADEWVRRAVRGGGLLSINHPTLGDMGWRRPMRERPPLVECWHATWDARQPEALDWWRRLGAGVPAGGSDFHRPGDRPPGSPTTWVEVEAHGEGPPPVRAVLDGLRQGRVAVAGDPRGPVMVRRDDRLLVVAGDGLRVVDEDGAARPVVGDRVSLPAAPGLHRLVQPDGAVCALCP